MKELKANVMIPPILKKVPAILVFLLPVFLIHFTDSILSFIFPIIVENISGSNTFMGLVMSLSSVIGLICDLTFPHVLKKHSWRFMLIIGIILEMFFLFSTFLGQEFKAFSFFLLGSIAWGIYYELLYFSEQNFVVLHEKKQNYSKFWGMLFAMAYVTGIIGPIVASNMLNQPPSQTTFILFVIMSFALVFAFLSLARFRAQTETLHTPEGQEHKSKFTVFKELKIWGIFSRKILPIIVVSISLEFIEAAFWTIGGLFGQEISSQINSGIFANADLDWVPIILYSFPMTVGNIIISRLNISSGKKRKALIFLFFGSLFLIPIGMVPNQYILIFIFIFVASFLLSFAGPLTEAVYSDLVIRAHGFKEDLVGLAQANSSLAYIVAPIVLGIISDATSYHTTFAILGIAGVIISIVFLIVTPRKLKLPISELDNDNK